MAVIYRGNDLGDQTQTYLLNLVNDVLTDKSKQYNSVKNIFKL